MIDLTEEQLRAIATEGESPPRLRDPRTQETFVLIRQDVYEKIQALRYDDGEVSVEDAYPLLDEMAAKAGWDDTALDVYNEPASGNPS